MTAAALAERFGVTLRTMYRDLESLRTAELPLVAERGRGGGFALARDYSMPPVNFTAREAAVLISAAGFLADGNSRRCRQVAPWAAVCQQSIWIPQWISIPFELPAR